MPEAYVLDTSAVFALFDREQGTEEVEALLRAALAGKCELLLCSVSIMEIYYLALKEQGEDKAAQLVALVKSWPVRWVDPDERILLQAGKLKAAHRLSVADALIAAVAKLYPATLVHKDPELAALEGEVSLWTLPMKPKKK